MKIKQKIKILLAGLTLFIGLAAVVTPGVVLADCGDVETSVINCNPQNAPGIQGTGIWAILILVINILAGGVGVVAVGGIVYAAILYASAGGSAEQTKKALEIIMNIVIGVLAFAGMWALLNFLVPGGLFA